MQIYGIDLAKSKFDVSFSHPGAEGNVTVLEHKVVGNTFTDISKFLSKLPSDATVVAEHTGVYGDNLLKMCTDRNVRTAFVGGYVIHTYRSSPDRRKTDERDCALLREFGERFYDKLRFTTFPGEALYELQQLASQRGRIVEEKKRLTTAARTEEFRPYSSLAIHRSNERIINFLDEEIRQIESEILSIIENDKELKRNYDIITSVKGVGMVTAVDIIVNTRNFTKITTAREYASYAGTAPFEKASGTMDKGAHVSSIGCKRAKCLLYMCAESSRRFNKEMKLYYERRTAIDKKHHFYVLNAIANKLLRIIFTLVKKGETFDEKYINKDPRTINKNSK